VGTVLPNGMRRGELPPAVGSSATDRAHPLGRT